MELNFLYRDKTNVPVYIGRPPVHAWDIRVRVIRKPRFHGSTFKKLT